MKRKVRVKGPGVKLNNIWCYINEVAVIDEAQYEENKEYVEVIEEIEENPNTKLKEENKSVDGSDINVGSIEKDIKRCEELIRPEHANWIGISNQLAIAHLIEKIKELEEENENKENKIWQLKETIQNLENECISLHELIDEEM